MAKEMLNQEVFEWLERQSWKGHDPFDGLHSKAAKPWVDGLLKNNRAATWVRLGLLQAVKRSPINIRPLLGGTPQENAMTWAVGILGRCVVQQRRPSSENLRWIENALKRLLVLRDPDTSIWGYPFAWQARAFYLPPGRPNLVISAVCVRALDEGLEVLNSTLPEVEQALVAAGKKISELFLKPEGYFSYVEKESVLVHNANLFGIEAVVRAQSRMKGEKPVADFKLIQALDHTLQAQREDGRWSYGTKPFHQWCDNFHTAYNLVSLLALEKRVPERSQFIQSAIERGLAYYLAHAFTEEGDARYYDNSTWPLETHSAAAALILFYELARVKKMPPELALEKSEKVRDSLVRHLYLGKGRFAYRKWPSYRVGTVFARWTQSWIYCGLEGLESLSQQVHGKDIDSQAKSR